jgi:hypothetical protein
MVSRNPMCGRTANEFPLVGENEARRARTKLSTEIDYSARRVNVHGRGGRGGSA